MTVEKHPISARRSFTRAASILLTCSSVFALASWSTVSRTEAAAPIMTKPFSLDWAGPLYPSEIQVNGRELLLRLAEPLDPAAATRTPKKLPNWIDGVVTGYDTLLVIAKVDQDFDVTESAGRVVVDLAPPTPAPVYAAVSTPSTSPAVGSKLREARSPRRIERLQARYLSETGESGEAVQMLDRLVDEDPKDVESLVQLAQVSSQRGKWRSAVKTFEQALSIKPGMIAAEREKIRLEEEFGPQARLDFDYQKVKKGDRQFIARFMGRAQATDRLEVGAILENRWLKDDEVQRPSGLLSAINEDRQRGELYLTLEHKNPQATRLALLAGPSSLGVQVDHMIRHGSDKQSRITFAYSRPYWEMVEGIVDGGTIDEIELHHERPLGPRFFGVVKANVANYSLKSENHLAQTAGGGLEIYYRFRDFGPVRTIGYAVDADYLLNRKNRLLPDLSDTFAVMQVPTQEFHSLNLAIEDKIGENFKYAIYSGYSYDRFGGDGPFVNANLASKPLKSLEVGARITHAQTSGRGSEGSFLLGGAYALWRF